MTTMLGMPDVPAQRGPQAAVRRHLAPIEVKRRGSYG